MANSTQTLGGQIRPFLLDVSRNLDFADGVLGVAFMPEGLNHVYFAEFVGPRLQGLAVDAELAEHQFYELDRMNYLSIEFQKAKKTRIELDREIVLSDDMEPLIRDPIITLFGGRASVPVEIGVFVEALKQRRSYLYYIPRTDQSNEAWDTLCHASFLVAQLLWSTLATAMAAGAVSRTVTRPILMCLPRYFPEYEDQIHQMLEDIDRVRSVAANVRDYIDIEARTIPSQSKAGAAQPMPYALSIRVTKEGSVPIEVLRLERQTNSAQSPFERSLFGKPSSKQQRKQAIAFLLLRKAMLSENDADRTDWRQLLPVLDATRGDRVLQLLDVLQGNAGKTAWTAAGSERVWTRNVADRRLSPEQVKKEARDFVRKRASDADKWLRKQLGFPTRESFWFVGHRDGSYQLHISTSLSPELQEAIRDVASPSQRDAWLWSLLRALHGGTEDDPQT